jgi:hypothetical protein
VAPSEVEAVVVLAVAVVVPLGEEGVASEAVGEPRVAVAASAEAVVVGVLAEVVAALAEDVVEVASEEDDDTPVSVTSIPLPCSFIISNGLCGTETAFRIGISLYPSTVREAV